METTFQIIETPAGPLCIGGKVYEAIAAVAGEVTAVGKTGQNREQNYKYRPIDEFMNALNPVMARHGLTVRPAKIENIATERVPTKSGGSMRADNIRVTFIFQHIDGSFAFAQTEGYGMDSGDKSINKAMAFAFKYLLMQAFVVPTAELKDGDSESPEAAHPVNGKAKPAPKPADKPTIDGERFTALLASIEAGEVDKKGKVIDAAYAKGVFSLTPEQEAQVDNAEKARNIFTPKTPAK